MPQKKKNSNKGRPPKYVLDDEGKEVVGLSYNPTNRMFYATSTSPRHYFKIGNVSEDKRKQEAIRLFQEWKKNQDLPAEDSTDAIAEDEIMVRARRMIEEGIYDDLIESKARELIHNDVYMNDDLLERAYDILMNNLDGYNTSKYHLRLSKVEKEIEKRINSLALKLLEENIRDGSYDRNIAIRLQNILRDKYKAAKLLKMPFLIFWSDMEEATKLAPLTWEDLWKIFTVLKEPDQYLYQEDWYEAVFNNIHGILKKESLKKVSFGEFKDACSRIFDLEDYLYEKGNEPAYVEENWKRYTPRQYLLLSKKSNCTRDPDSHPFDQILSKQKEISKVFLRIPYKARIKILRDIAQTVENAGFPQGGYILRYIDSLSGE